MPAAHLVIHEVIQFGLDFFVRHMGNALSYTVGARLSARHNELQWEVHVWH